MLTSHVDSIKVFQKSVFDLQPCERIALFEVVIQQLLSYHKFRSTSDERIISLLDVRKELKNLRNFDAVQVLLCFFHCSNVVFCLGTFRNFFRSSILTISCYEFYLRASLYTFMKEILK